MLLFLSQLFRKQRGDENVRRLFAMLECSVVWNCGLLRTISINMKTLHIFLFGNYSNGSEQNEIL